MEEPRAQGETKQGTLQAHIWAWATGGRMEGASPAPAVTVRLGSVLNVPGEMGRLSAIHQSW